ncbi:GIY-YIG nuclease family protein [Burkholderia cepacia]|uniref:GIY-YIG nuclease family protein n=1 Tax=Burkholderia cepacia TaxID=292 RepID=UPI000752B9C4|nr:GIY-YIG nuclease family protein [Burkholderia cepacia]KVX52823.1 excinuclease ABC subunit C [Burkholderia cepacia]KWD55856.1 excinuclease ABC subunit C [Burkholderia cepacia]KWD70704.1 excinuclease ABC subunit C [Burkholderia cepacia]
MSWFLYLIECADDSVYTGITTDVAARFDEHASGKGARYTRSRKPRAVLASFPLPDRSIASRAEYWVKRLTAAQKRELAAGIRTLESVLPAGMSIDGNVDAAGLKAGKRGRKKAKAQSVDIATQAAETDKPVKKAAKAENDGKASVPAKTVKRGQAAQAPKKTKATPATKRAKTDDAAEVKKGSSRGKAATKATKAAPKQKAPAAGGKSVAKPRTDVAAAPARSRASATKTTTDTVETPANPVTATGRATRANRARSASNATALPAPAPARARKKATPGAGPRTKQNRAAS